MSLRDGARAFARKVEIRSQQHLVRTAELVHESIVEGSPVTGAPGSPVDTGNLKASWHLEFPSPTSARISTNVVYAQQIEDGARDGRPLTLRSSTGGFHSVKLTMQHLDKLARQALQEVTGA